MIALADPRFTLEWTHSIEHERWRESWHIDDRVMVLDQAMVKTSGAGMEPGPDARLVDGWWVWTPTLPPQSQVLLAASGTSASGWQICDGNDRCHILGLTAAKPIPLRPCGAK